MSARRPLGKRSLGFRMNLLTLGNVMFLTPHIGVIYGQMPDWSRFAIPAAALLWSTVMMFRAGLIGRTPKKAGTWRDTDAQMNIRLNAGMTLIHATVLGIVATGWTPGI